MAWQNFPQFDLYNATRAHAKDYWTVTWDNGTVPGYDDWACKVDGRCHGGTYNQSNPAMRKAWVDGMASAMATGLIDGFFIDITPQVLPNVSDPTDPVDAPVPYAKNVDSLCEFCSAERRAALLDGLGLALAELAAACPTAVIICNPTDYGACNTQFFVRSPCPAPPGSACKNPSCVSQEYFGSSADHGRSVLGDYHILQNKYPQTHHLVQARAASQPPSFLFHIAEFLIR